MFEQTTPQSKCCLGSLQELYLDVTACLAWMDQKYLRKGPLLCQKYPSQLFFYFYLFIFNFSCFFFVCLFFL